MTNTDELLTAGKRFGNVKPQQIQTHTIEGDGDLNNPHRIHTSLGGRRLDIDFETQPPSEYGTRVMLIVSSANDKGCPVQYGRSLRYLPDGATIQDVIKAVKNKASKIINGRIEWQAMPYADTPNWLYLDGKKPISRKQKIDNWISDRALEQAGQVADKAMNQKFFNTPMDSLDPDIVSIYMDLQDKAIDASLEAIQNCEFYNRRGIESNEFRNSDIGFNEAMNAIESNQSEYSHLIS